VIAPQADGVLDRIGDCGADRRDATLASALDAERVEAGSCGERP